MNGKVYNTKTFKKVKVGLAGFEPTTIWCPRRLCLMSQTLHQAKLQPHEGILRIIAIPSSENSRTSSIAVATIWRHDTA